MILHQAGEGDSDMVMAGRYSATLFERTAQEDNHLENETEDGQ